MLPGTPLPDADPSSLEAAVPESGELPEGLLVEPGRRVEEAADTPSLLPPVPSEEDPAQESYARAEPVPDADVQPSEIASHDVEPSFVAPIAEAEPPSSEAVPADGIQIASEAQFAIDDRTAEVPEDLAGGLPGATREIEPSAALAAADSNEAADEPPERTPLLALGSADETIIAAKPPQDEPAFVPPRPVPEAPASAAAIEPPEDDAGFIPTRPAPAPPASVAATKGASSSAEYVQHFPMVVLNGTPLGAITLREFEGNQRLIHLGALLSLFRSRMNSVEYERLISAASADQFVSLEVLRQAGLDAQYDARRGRLTIGSLNNPLDE